MRIVAGMLGRRIFDAPSGSTHPMGERARGALFNSLGDISGMKVLDAFAGSGALAFEALSRGANSSIMIENDARAQKTIEKNINVLGLSSKAKLIKAGLGSWLEHTADDNFDLILADPPYDKLQINLLKRLPELLSPEGILILSWPGKAEPIKIEGLTRQALKSYGDAQLVFYSRT